MNVIARLLHMMIREEPEKKAADCKCVRVPSTLEYVTGTTE